MNNTAWYKDNDGSIINITAGSLALDVSINYDNWLNTTEYLTSAVFTTPSGIDQLGDFTSNGGTSGVKQHIAVLLANYNTTGVYNCDSVVITSEGRTFSNRFKIKVI